MLTHIVYCQLVDLYRTWRKGLQIVSLRVLICHHGRTVASLKVLLMFLLMLGNISSDIYLIFQNERAENMQGFGRFSAKMNFEENTPFCQYK